MLPNRGEHPFPGAAMTKPAKAAGFTNPGTDQIRPSSMAFGSGNTPVTVPHWQSALNLSATWIEVVARMADGLSKTEDERWQGARMTEAFAMP